MYRLHGDRVSLDLDGNVEVEPILSDVVAYECLRLHVAWLNARSGSEDEYRALVDLIERFLAEALPVWDYADHRGPIPMTVRGMTRLPLNTRVAIFTQWLNTYADSQEETAREPLEGVTDVDAPSAPDALLPPPVAREVKRRLRLVKKAA